MLIFERTIPLQLHITTLKNNGLRIGFVPTMGALHLGHVALIRQCIQQGCHAICSIFVNPTQFNNPKDLEKYPRTLEQDLAMLKEAGCHAVFIPSVDEIYGDAPTYNFDFGELEKILEGKYRPGHFKGVATVVSLLFDAVKPHKAYFGKKDYQQLLIIQNLVKQQQRPIEIVACPTVREADGLAMSSRNIRLTAQQRKKALFIPQLLKEACELKKNGNEIAYIKTELLKRISVDPEFKLEYIEFCNKQTLQTLIKVESTFPCIVLIACYLGEIRLIDNMEC